MTDKIVRSSVGGAENRSDKTSLYRILQSSVQDRLNSVTHFRFVCTFHITHCAYTFNLVLDTFILVTYLIPWLLIKSIFISYHIFVRYRINRFLKVFSIKQRVFLALVHPLVSINIYYYSTMFTEQLTFRAVMIKY